MSIVELTSAPHRASEALAALPVAIIGAGPVGLAAAAHLSERGIPFELFERGASVAAAMTEWGHVRLFSSWQLIVDAASRRLLADAGWMSPDPHTIPHGRDIVAHYLEPLAQLPQIAPHLSLGTEVVSVTRKGMDRTRTTGRQDRPFRLVLRDTAGAISTMDARAVIDASGTWASPNPVTSDGVDGVPSAVASRIHSPLPDVLGVNRAAFAGKRTAVVGSGHSAANTLLALAELAESEPSTTVLWIMRRSYPQAGLGDATDALRERGRLGRRVHSLVTGGRIELFDSFELAELQERGDKIALVGSTVDGMRELLVDEVVASTGFRPDLSGLREIRLALDEIVEAPRLLAPLIDPNIHSCGTVPPHGVVELTHPEKDFYLVGMKSYGRAPTFLLATGYEQVRSVAAELGGDPVAARRVEFTLPTSGACGSSGSCC